jgi:superfamily II DNA or RNA helicase
VICAPTASGKTNIAISILKALPKGCPTLVLANKKSLVEQNYEEITKWGFENVGRLYGKYKKPDVITCATVQSLHKMEPLLEKIKVLIVDEIHENMSAGPKKYFNKMKSCSVRAAISATPFKFGGRDSCQKWLVKGYFGPALKSKSAGGILTTKHLQERGTLSKSICTFYPVREPDLKYEVYMDAVTRGIAENWHFHEMVRDLVAKLDGRTLVLVERIAQGDSLASLIPGSLWVQGKDDLDTRKMVIDKLKSSKERVVAIGTQQIFTAGINVMTHNVINAAGGQADHHIIQRVGRGLRTASDKEILNYYDFVFYNNEYLMNHSRKRMAILKREGHEVVIKNETDF